jgi:hypothetical protein
VDCWYVLHSRFRPSSLCRWISDPVQSRKIDLARTRLCFRLEMEALVMVIAWFVWVMWWSVATTTSTNNARPAAETRQNDRRTNDADEDLATAVGFVCVKDHDDIYCCGNRTSVSTTKAPGWCQSTVICTIRKWWETRNDIRHKLCLGHRAEKRQSRIGRTKMNKTYLRPMTFLDVDETSVAPTNSTRIQQRLAGPMGHHQTLIGNQLDCFDGGRSWLETIEIGQNDKRR